MVRSSPRSNAAERARRYRARKKEKKEASKPILGRDGASSGAAFHQMQLEWENTKRQNDRLQKMVDDLQHQMHNLNAAMMANAGGGVPQSGGPVNRMPSPPIAQPQPVARPRAPSFGPVLMDVQSHMINLHHASRKPGA